MPVFIVHGLQAFVRFNSVKAAAGKIILLSLLHSLQLSLLRAS